MAGSAALLVLTLSQAGTAAMALLYILLFGLGSMLGMAALSAIIAAPLVISAHRLAWANHALQLLVAAVTVGIGVTTIYGAAFAAGR